MAGENTLEFRVTITGEIDMDGTARLVVTHVRADGLHDRDESTVTGMPWGEAVQTMADRVPAIVAARLEGRKPRRRTIVRKECSVCRASWETHPTVTLAGGGVATACEGARCLLVYYQEAGSV